MKSNTKKLSLEDYSSVEEFTDALAESWSKHRNLTTIVCMKSMYKHWKVDNLSIRCKESLAKKAYLGKYSFKKLKYDLNNYDLFRFAFYNLEITLKKRLSHRSIKAYGFKLN